VIFVGSRGVLTLIALQEIERLPNEGIVVDDTVMLTSGSGWPGSEEQFSVY
jgi:hypothetical protein